MTATLFFALAVVYLVGVVGIVFVGSFIGSPEDAPTRLEDGLDDRLAGVRGTEARPKRRTTAPAAVPYFVRVGRKR
ncbi:MAG: hypothetical protein QOD72_2755 [Acidimicrobiaceae bacterium]|nr:hypothetical protein [Acidimicrobiaceae bacterium]